MTTNVIQALDQDDRNRVMIVCDIALALGVQQFSMEDGVWNDFSLSEAMTPTMRM
jgi:hypothetical protein